MPNPDRAERPRRAAGQAAAAEARSAAGSKKTKAAKKPSKATRASASTVSAGAKAKAKPAKKATSTKTAKAAKKVRAGTASKSTAAKVVAPRATTTDAATDDAAPREVGEVGRAGAPAQGRELRERGKKTMRKLLDAGIEVFSTRGYHAARVDDIVKAAATSHGTFYLYFSNKEDLFQALVSDVADELAAVTASLGPINADAEGRAELRAWLERFSIMYVHYGPIIRTWTEAEIGTSEAGRVGADVLGDLALGLGSRVTGAGDRGINPTIAALAVIAMVERLNYFVISGQLDTDQDHMLDVLTDVAFASLFA